MKIYQIEVILRGREDLGWELYIPDLRDYNRAEQIFIILTGNPYVICCRIKEYTLENEQIIKFNHKAFEITEE